MHYEIINHIRIRGKINSTEHLYFFIPGGPIFSSDYLLVSAPLICAQHSSYLIVDLPNQDGTNLQKEIKYSEIPGLYLDLIMIVITKYQFNSISIIGHSLGGLISLSLAPKINNKLVRTLTLVSTPFIFSPSEKFTEIKNQVLKKSTYNFNNLSENIEYLNQMKPAYFPIDSKIKFEKSFNLYTKVCHSKLIYSIMPSDNDFINILNAAEEFSSLIHYIYGEQDYLLGIESHKIVNKILNNENVFKITESGHFPMLDNPMKFKESIDNIHSK